MLTKNTFSRRKLLQAGAAAAAAATLSSLSLSSFAGQFRGKEIVIGGAGSHRAFMEPLIPVFEQETGCKVIFEATRSLVNLQKMVSNKDRPYLSVVMMDDPVLIPAVKEGVLARLDGNNIPSLANVMPGAVHMDGMWANYMHATTGVAINSNRVSEEPSSYEALWSPSYNGRLIIPSLQNTEGLSMLFIAASLESGKPLESAQYEIEAAFQKLRGLKENLLTIYTQLPQAMNLLEQGEASAIAGMLGVSVLDRKSRGAPVEFVLPKEGGMVMPNGIAKVNGAPEPELADLFIEYMLGAWQKPITETAASRPTNSTVEVPSGVPEGEIFVPDWEYIAEHRQSWVERWDREMAI